MNPFARMLRSTRLQQRALDSFTEHPGLTEQLLRVQGLSLSNWYPPSIQEAMGVPAVFRAVTLISGLIGSLTMEAWRNGQRMVVAPTLVSRPGVFTDPYDFWRDTGHSLATRGEYLWWTVDRDVDGLAKKLLLLPPGEVTVSWNQSIPILRDYEWRGKKLDRDDVTHRTFSREPGALRGQGPLQLCGAALSAAVEADEWAARFFKRGGAPATVLEHPTNMSGAEARDLKSQWLETEGNEVKVAAGGTKAVAVEVNPEAAQLLESRGYSASSIATAFGMDADMLNAAQSGTSITYGNVGQRFDNFVRSTLGPNYLEPIEHGISELLPRTTVARFNLQGLLRADVKTQADVYSTLTSAGMEASQAAEIAGIGSLVDTLPVPAPERFRIEVPA